MPGILRVRFATSHPVDFSEALVEVLAEGEGVCPSLNLPVQSGSDRILAAMGRGYTRDRYRSAAALLRQRVPEVGFTTDLIVGFPGETEEDFLQSLDLLEELRFDQVHTAAYSVRPGTRAEGLEGHLDPRTKARRLNEVNRIQARIAREINEACVGPGLPGPDGGPPPPRGRGCGRGAPPRTRWCSSRGRRRSGRSFSWRSVPPRTWYLHGAVVPREG